jgi:multicomponent Na+:H+ antiporter subunit D
LKVQPALVSLADWLVILPVVLPLMGAALLLMSGGRPDPRWPTLLVTLLVGLVDALLLHRVLVTGPVSMTMGRWLPPFGISFTADAIGAGFALAAAFVTAIVLVYTKTEPTGRLRRVGYHGLALMLLTGVGGAFLTGDLFNLYVWFEVMLIASFGLLVLSGTPLAIDGAVKYGVVNFLATSLFLVALGLLYGALGTLNMADIIAAARHAPPATMAPIAALFLVAFGTKAAALPANGWLPASYHAPPAATSALLGGLLTKVGAYALLRTLVLLLPASRDLLQPVLATVAGITLLLAPLGAIAETNLRRAVGYLLIGGIGAIIAGIALPTANGIGGSAAYIAHALLTITALYLVSGLIEVSTGETDTRRMGGLYAANAPLSALFLLLVVSIAGLPPFLGFWPKLLLVEAAIERAGLAGGPGPADPLALPLAIILLVNAVLTLIAGARLWSHMFWRPLAAEVRQVAREPAGTAPSRLDLAAAGALTALVVAAGLWPGPLLGFARAAAASLLDAHGYVAAVGLAPR